MKKTLLFLAVAIFMTSGCSKTWSGIKQDSYDAMINTKEVIHEVTAPDEYISASGRIINPTNNPSVQVVDSINPVKMNTVQNTVVNNVQTTRYSPVSKVQVFEDSPTVVTTTN